MMTPPRFFSSLKKQFVCGVLGISLDYFDLFLWGYLSLFLAPLVFPFEEARTHTLVAALIFFSSFLAKPIGAILFGHMGDTIGRKCVFTWCTSIYVISSLCIAILPTYEHIGYLSIALLLFFRALQGIGTGAEMSGTLTLLMEESPFKSKSFSGSFLSLAACLGTVLATLTIVFISPFFWLSDTYHWIWRLPVAFGGLGLFLVVYAHHFFKESEEFLTLKEQGGLLRFPLLEILKRHKLTLMQIILLTILVPIINAVIFGYIPMMAPKELQLPASTGFWSNVISLSAFAIVAPFWGIFADKLTLPRHLIFITLIIAVCTLPLLAVAFQGKAIYLVLGQLFLSIISAGYFGIIVVQAVFLSAAQYRCTAVALGYTLAMILFGQMASEFIIHLLMKEGHHGIFPGFYLIFGAIIVCGTLLTMRNKLKMIT